MALAHFPLEPPTRHASPRFFRSTRFLLLAGFAVAIGGLSTLGAWVLLAAIRFFTNLFFFQTFSLAPHSAADNALGAYVIAIPALGGLIVGLIARYGRRKNPRPRHPGSTRSDPVRQKPHVAESRAAETALVRIVIGSGGPFGAEGPVIMTGGAIASLLAQATAFESR